MKARSNTRLAVAALLIALVAMSVVLPAAAQAPRPMRHGSLPAPEGASSEKIERVVRDAIRRPDGRIEVIVTLAGQPAVEAYIAAGGKAARGSALSQASGREEALRAEQNLFAATAAGLGAEVVNSHTFLVNTVTMAVYPDQVARLWLIPGVVSITPNRIFEREDTTSVPLIRAPQVWDPAGLSLTGEGVVIGVIDTGIDYTHAHFGGPGDYAAAGDTTDAADAPGLFPATAPVALGAPKVIGGYDIVGDLFNPGEPGSVQTPDGDPVDCPVADGGGHGSHVAGTAAGWGVEADGDTYTGPLNPSIYGSLPNVTTTFNIGPGVAPAASLVAIRVFGCEGATNTDVLLDAIEYTVTGDFPGTTGDVLGGVDVVNMSIGSGYGGSYDDDPLIAAQEAATDAGVIYVESAGNSGNVTLVSGAPGTTNSVINVASTTDTTAVADSLLVRNNGSGAPVKYFAQPGAAHNADPVPFTGTLVIADPPEACSPLTNAAEVAGNVVLIVRGNPPAPGVACPLGFADKQNNAFAAGASGVIVYNHAAGGNSLISMTNVGVVAGYDLPTYFIGNSAGLDLVAQVGALGSGNVSVTFDFGDPAFYAAESADQISSFSSRGGVVRSVGDVTLKPNVAAPGNTIVSARSGAGTAFYVIGGTSMASPHVAGLAALLREQYPTRTVAEIKAMIMNTATRDVTGAQPAVVHPPQRVGSGRIDALDAANTNMIAYWTENPENVALSFGYPKVLPGSVTTFTETITIKNFGGTAYDLAAAYESRADMGGVEITVDPTVTVGAGATATITVTLSINPDANPTPNQLTYAVDTAITGATFLTEEAGNIVLTAAGHPDLHVPVYAAPHVASDMSSTLSINNAFAIPSIDLSGTEIDTNDGALGTSIASLATAFELVADDGVDATGSFAPRPGDDYPQDDNPVDIDKVGITSDALVRPNPVNTIAYFAISTFKEWNRPAEVEYSIYIDEDHDGDEDWILFNAGSTTNGFVVAVVDVNGVLTGNVPGDVEVYDYLNYYPGASVDLMLYKNNVMVFPFRVGLTIDGTFSYWIESYSQDSDFTVLSDTVGSASSPLYYDALNPTLSFNDDTNASGEGSFTGLPFWFDWDGYSIPVDVHPSADTDNLPDILVLHHHNQDPATRAEVLDTATLVDSLGGFELLTPVNNSIILDPADFTSVTWEDVEGTGVLWRFILTQISTNTRLGQVVDLTSLTAVADADDLTCAAGVCTLDVSGLPALEDGTYSWTATYTDGLNNEHEATNAPFFFKVESNDVNLLANPGFEDCIAGNPAIWGGTAPCKNKPAKAHSGNAYLLSTAGNYGVQKVRSSNSAVLDAQATGDVLNFGGYFKGGAAAKTVFVLTIRYPGGGNQKAKLTITSSTTGYQLFADSVTLTGDPVWVKARVGSATAKVFIDDLYLSTVGVNGPETRAAGDLLPPPSAPDGFRGNN